MALSSLTLVRPHLIRQLHVCYRPPTRARACVRVCVCVSVCVCVCCIYFTKRKKGKSREGGRERSRAARVESKSEASPPPKPAPAGVEGAKGQSQESRKAMASRSRATPGEEDRKSLNRNISLCVHFSLCVYFKKGQIEGLGGSRAKTQCVLMYPPRTHTRMQQQVSGMAIPNSRFFRFCQKQSRFEHIPNSQFLINPHCSCP